MEIEKEETIKQVIDSLIDRIDNIKHIVAIVEYKNDYKECAYFIKADDDCKLETIVYMTTIAINHIINLED